VSAEVYDNIMALAQKESASARHFYVGVEHLFMALTRLEGGVTTGVLEEQGIAPRFMRYMLRQELGQGDNRRFWPGFRETPRLQAVLRLAHALAREGGRELPAERDLLLAILREGDSLPIRVLQAMEADLDRLEVMAANWSSDHRLQPVPVPVQIQDPAVILSADEEEVLRQMFPGHKRVVIERQLHGGYSSARVLVVTPYQADGRAMAAVVVKLADRQAILYEKMRFDTFVRDTLPPTTSRVVGNPVLPEKSLLGGLKYTFIRERGAPGPVDLADYGREHGPEALADLLRQSLFRVFGETWWSQRHPYQFGVWQEYELLLPPSLVVEVAPDLGTPRRRLTPLGQWSRRGRFAHGEVVALDGFTVEDFYPERQGIQLTAGAGADAQNRAGKVEVRGIPDAMRTYYRGMMVNQIVGRVLYMRDELLLQQGLDLDPDFDLTQERLPAQPVFPFSLPNPLRRYQNLLQRRMTGSLSTIHGDLHLHNILVGPGGNAWLIDFAQTREGHTLFDWAVLEVSLLSEYIAPHLRSERWEDIWPIISLLAEIGQRGRLAGDANPLARALKTIMAVRDIVAACLAEPDDWREYYVALGLCALRGMRWTRTVSLGGRRLLFLVSALAMAQAMGRDGVSGSSPDVDTTDFNIEITDVISGQRMQEALRGSETYLSNSDDFGMDEDFEPPPQDEGNAP